MGSELKLKSLSRNEHTGNLTAHYSVMHWGNPMCLTYSLTLTETHKGFEANISFDGCEKPTAEEAIRKLAEWCGRAADSLTNLKIGKTIPIGEPFRENAS